jgi:hypothetical protein
LNWIELNWIELYLGILHMYHGTCLTVSPMLGQYLKALNEYYVIVGRPRWELNWIELNFIWENYIGTKGHVLLLVPCWDNTSRHSMNITSLLEGQGENWIELNWTLFGKIT